MGAGKFIRKFPQQYDGGSRSEGLQYAFYSAARKHFENQNHRSQEYFEVYKEGDNIDIVYLPDKPGIGTPAI